MEKQNHHRHPSKFSTAKYIFLARKKDFWCFEFAVFPSSDLFFREFGKAKSLIWSLKSEINIFIDLFFPPQNIFFSHAELISGASSLLFFQSSNLFFRKFGEAKRLFWRSKNKITIVIHLNCLSQNMFFSHAG